MNKTVRTTLIGAAAALATTAAVAQAAGADGSAAGSASKLHVTLDDFKLNPDHAKLRAGTVKIKATNKGVAEHELVIAKTKRKPGNLPTTKNGDVDEDALNIPGEIPETQPKDTGKLKLDLKPGKYVMFCNVPGHYAQGMYGKLTAK